ncbi:MAG: hypothetical protein QOJ32_3328 [Frankiaceae bacterium]|nr:hypothetical protein [Frankiaceae bacterium]
MPNEPSDPSRKSGGDETRLVETRLVDTRPVLPVPRHATTSASGAVDATVPIPRQLTNPESEVRLRFGPGVPAQRRPRSPDDEVTLSPPTDRRWRVLNILLTTALALVVLWLLWPSHPIEVRQVTVRAPAVVSCGSSADVVATLQTNGRAGDVRYRWVRNDGLTSEVLTTSPPDGKSTVDVHLRWTFTGPGTYAAQVTIEVIEPQATAAATSFTYRC